MQVNFTHDRYGDATMINLSFLDVIKLLCGYELRDYDLRFTTRIQITYELFNLSAPKVE